MNLARICSVGALSALLLGCAGGTIITQDHAVPAPSYFNGDFDYATRLGAIRTEVAGLPFDTDPKTFQASVRSLMDRQNRGVPARFVAEHGDDTDPAFKVVVAFNLAPRYSGVDLCRGTEGLQMLGPARTVKVDMAFCIGDQLKTETQGRLIGGTPGPDDRQFAALVRQTTRTLIPARDGHDGGGEIDPTS